MKPEDVPILIYRHKEDSPLDIAIKKNDIGCVNILVNVILKY